MEYPRHFACGTQLTGSNVDVWNRLLWTGSLGFGLARETEIVCGVRKADNSFEKMSYTFGAKDMGWEKEVSACSAIVSFLLLRRIWVISWQDLLCLVSRHSMW